MGLSFDDEPSLVEAVGSLQFRAADPNPIPRMGSTISQDGILSIGSQDVDAIPDVEMKSDDDIGGSDDIQMIDE